MDTIEIPLVRDPVLRASLRRLYPELPAWARGWFIATPNRPLPLPPAHAATAWDSAAAALEALEATCAAVNAHDPPKPWMVLEESGLGSKFYWAGPPNSTRKEPATHPAAAGHTTAYRTDLAGTSPLRLSLQHGQGARFLTLEFPRKPLIDWTYVDNTLGVSTMQGRGITFSSNLVGRYAAEVFADGTTRDLLLDNLVPVHAQNAKVPHVDTSGDPSSLLARWRALRSASDRARIAAFWLGHRHPVLAAAGLQIATTPQPHRPIR